MALTHKNVTDVIGAIMANPASVKAIKQNLAVYDENGNYIPESSRQSKPAQRDRYTMMGNLGRQAAGIKLTTLPDKQ